MARLGLIGAGGRMGIALIQAISDQGHVLASACERAEHPALGRDVGIWVGRDPMGVLIGDDVEACLRACEVAIDFTTPATSVAHAGLAAGLGRGMVIGATGFSALEDAAIATAAQKTAIVKAGNFSLGVAVATKLVETLSRTLPDFDIEIIEMHHRSKIDAPSGTALMLGHAAAAGRGLDFDKVAVTARQGHVGPRPKDAIGFMSLRGGTVVGDHRVIAAGPRERIEIAHIAEDRSIFALGALTAALWLKGRPPGLYSIHDVLGL